MFVIDEQGIEFSSHRLWLLVKRNGFCDVLGGKNVGFPYCYSADHHFVIILVLFSQSLKLEMPIVEVHDILESLLANRGEVFRWFQLGLRHYEIQHHFFLMFTDELALVD